MIWALWAGFLSYALSDPAAAQTAETAGPQPEFGPRKIFIMLFLMLGPIKVLVPFVEMTWGADTSFRRKLAARATLFSAAALVLAGVLGRNMMESFDISLPVLALTGGVILFLVALQTVLRQSSGAVPPARQNGRPVELNIALTPLAFPIIVTPYGIAALIVFATLAGGDREAELMVGGIVLLILAMDWLAMLFAGAILRSLGTALQVFAVVLGVTQVALGLQVILHSLAMVGVFVENPTWVTP
jgi:multiple antibiotic resistance protein